LQSCASFDIGLHAERRAGIVVYLDATSPVQKCHLDVLYQYMLRLWTMYFWDVVEQVW
jgi:hypothetical protein